MPAIQNTISRLCSTDSPKPGWPWVVGRMGHVGQHGSLFGIEAIWVCLWVRSQLLHFSMPTVGHGGAHGTGTLPRPSPGDGKMQAFWSFGKRHTFWPSEWELGRNFGFFLRCVYMVPDLFRSWQRFWGDRDLRGQPYPYPGGTAPSALMGAHLAVLFGGKCTLQATPWESRGFPQTGLLP